MDPYSPNLLIGNLQREITHMIRIKALCHRIINNGRIGEGWAIGFWFSGENRNIKPIDSVAKHSHFSAYTSFIAYKDIQAYCHPSRANILSALVQTGWSVQMRSDRNDTVLNQISSVTELWLTIQTPSQCTSHQQLSKAGLAIRLSLAPHWLIYRCRFVDLILTACNPNFRAEIIKIGPEMKHCENRELLSTRRLGSLNILLKVGKPSLAYKSFAYDFPHLSHPSKNGRLHWIITPAPNYKWVD